MALVLASPGGEMRIVAQADQPFDVRETGATSGRSPMSGAGD
jgi:hypothetical protein